jgi:hypothetical protein
VLHAVEAPFQRDGVKMGIKARDLPVESAVATEEHAHALSEQQGALL